MKDNFGVRGFAAVLVGEQSLTIACGDILRAAGHRIAAVISCDAAVRDWAEAQDLRLFENAGALLEDDNLEAVDWLLSIANLTILPKPLLELPRQGSVNFHDGPLPRYAGLNTPAWAIINGERSHGVSWHLIEGAVDEGDLLAQREVAISSEETAFSLNSKCYAAGLDSFSDVLAQLEDGILQRRAQDLSQRSYFARDARPAGLGLIDFGQSSATISALVRGLTFGGYWNPLCSAKLVVGGHMWLVGKAALCPAPETSEPGRVLACTTQEVVVATSDGAVRLQDLRASDGMAADLTNLFGVGDKLACADHGEVPGALIREEAHWRAALQSMQALKVPLAATAGGRGQEMRRELSLPDGLKPSLIITAAALSALRGANVTAGDLALTTGMALDGTSNDWLPLRLDAVADKMVSEAVGVIETQLDRAAPSPGLAQDLPLRDPEIGPLTCPEFAISTTGQAIIGAVLTLAVQDHGATLIHDATRIPPPVAELLAGRIEAACRAIVAGAVSCGEVWAMPACEQALLLEKWNDTQTDFNGSLTLHAAFEAQAALTPEAVALVFEDRHLSYRDLNERANRLAHVLRAMGAKRSMPIGLHVARGIDLVVGALGILKSGGAYLPLDPTYPPERIAHFIRDSTAPIILTQETLAGQLPHSFATILRLDNDPRLQNADTENLDPVAVPQDMAYLIYTSGSTGTPKGVMVSHANVANFFAGMDQRISHDPGAVWLALTSLSFDISVLELFWTLSRGFKLVLAGDDSRTMRAEAPRTSTGRRLDFNLFYWGNDDGAGAQKYRLLLEGARFADENGFNAVWTPERHFHAFGGPYPNPSVTGAAVAAVTSNLDVRAGSCVAPLHHPARIAEEWAVIDNLTNGRVGLAIASGWQPDDFILRPENTPPDNKAAMYESITQLRALWRGEAVEFPTHDGAPFAVLTQPRPVSRELPIWVTTAGNPQTWKEAGEIGANVLTHLLGQSVAEVGDKIRIYHDALRAGGHDPADHKVSVMLHTYLADSRQEAEDIARAPMKEYLRSAAGLIKQYAWAFPAFKKPEGVSNPFEVDLESLAPEEMEAILDFAFERYFNDSGMFGTVADGLARAEELRRIGVDEIACLIDYGIATDTVLAGLRPLAEVLARTNQKATLAPDDFSLAGQIIRHGVTHMQCTPSMAQMLVTNEQTSDALSGLQEILIGGEALPGALLKALEQCSPAQIHNMYGPTETTIWSTSLSIGNQRPDIAPIGTPIANTQIYVLDANLQPLPVGAPGQLWIGGAGVTPGYWQREALTAERFIMNPFAAGRIYDTGDLAFWGAEGVLHFAGRADHQVKIRGHRIELGEIEARLAELQGVSQAVVVARETDGGAQLVAYVTAQEGFNVNAARHRLAERLPEIMLPSVIMPLQAMPLTPNRKIDRKALPAPQTRALVPKTAPVATESDIEATIAAIWSRILGVGDIRTDDNFFALGGHSLLAVQAHRDIKTALGDTRLTITDIFRFPVLGKLAEHLQAGQGASVSPPEEATLQDTTRSEIIGKRRAMRARRRENAL